MSVYENTNMRKNTKWIWLIAWVLALSVRLIFPLADPPIDLSWSGGYMADEGFWVHDARNQIIFNDYGPDQWHNRFVSPLAHYPVLMLFKLLGVSLLSVRIWAAILSIISLIFLDRITRRLEPSGYLFLAFAVNSTLVAFQRLAILESVVLPVALGTMWLWLRSRENNSGKIQIVMNITTGISAALVWQIKSTQLYFIPVVLLATYLSEPSGKRARKFILLQSAGAFIVVASWFFLVRLPNAVQLSQYNAFYLSQQGSQLMDFLKNIVMQPIGIYFSRMPIMFPAGIFLACRLLLKGKFRLQPPVITFAWTWLIFGFLFLAPMGYRPFRYYLPLLIPITILGWRCLMDAHPSVQSSVKIWIARVFTLMLILANIPFLLDRFLTDGQLLGIPLVTGFPVAGALVCLPATIVLFVITGRKHTETSSIIFPRLILFMLILSYSFQTIKIADRFIHRRYDIVETSRTLAHILPDQSVVAGQWAPELSLETPFRVIPLWKGFVNWEDPFTIFGVTHVLSWEYSLGNELEHQKEWFPEIMGAASKINTFRIKDSNVSLWKIKKQSAD